MSKNRFGESSGFKMNGSPAKIGTIEGTSGHASVLRQIEEEEEKTIVEREKTIPQEGAPPQKELKVETSDVDQPDVKTETAKTDIDLNPDEGASVIEGAAAQEAKSNVPTDQQGAFDEIGEGLARGFEETGKGIAKGISETKEQIAEFFQTMYGGSDRRLKKDIRLIDKSPSGLNIYSFKYIDSKYGEGTYQGVMSDEIPSDAVVVNSDGYDMVDYSGIDVDFKQI